MQDWINQDCIVFIYLLCLFIYLLLLYLTFYLQFTIHGNFHICVQNIIIFYLHVHPYKNNPL